MRQFFYLLILAGLGAATLLAEPIRIGVEQDQPPLSFVNQSGQPDGFSAALLQAMSKDEPMEIQIVPDYWTALLQQFQEGKLDALANVLITPERRETMDFSIAHAFVHAVICYRKGSPPLRTTAQLAGKRIAMLAGSISYQQAAESHFWGSRVVLFQRWQQAVDAVQRGECDAALFINTPWAADVLKAAHMKWNLVDDVVYTYHFAVHKGDSRTLERINEALATVRANGEFDEIYARWIGPIEPHPIHWVDVRPYVAPVVLALLALAGFFAWQRYMMRRLVRQAEQLRVSEERWKFALEGSGDGMWDWDMRTDRVLYSKRWKGILGYAEEDIGPDLREWRARVHPDDWLRVTAAQAAQERGETPLLSTEYRLKCKDGTWKWVLNRSMVVRRDAAGRSLRKIGTLTDLTDRKRAEEHRLVLSKLESVGVLAGGIAHDFNNLLTTILLNLDLVKQEGLLTASLAPRIDVAEKAVLAARELTQQLVTFSKGGSQSVRRSEIGGLMRESVALALSGSTVHADFSIANGLWPVEMDPGQIGQVFRNLTLNAREAMGDAGVLKLEAKNVILAADAVPGLPAGNYLQIGVTDEGPGIPPEQQARIFDPYFSTKQRGAKKGMGLGLTICHSVVQSHHGAIVVNSAVGRGTTMLVYLPAVVVEGQAPA